MPVQRHSMAERQNQQLSVANEGGALPPAPSRQRASASRPRLPSPDEAENGDLPPPIPKRKSESPLESYNKSRERRPLTELDTLSLDADVIDSSTSAYPAQPNRTSMYMQENTYTSDQHNVTPPAQQYARRHPDRSVPDRKSVV